MRSSRWIVGFAVGLLGCFGGVSQNPNAPQYKTIFHEDGTVIHLSNYVLNRAGFLYDDLWRELPLCLTGQRVGDNIYVRDVRMPLYNSSESNSASFNTSVCGEQYIGIIHNHPSGHNNCTPSRVDFERFINDGDALVEMVVCGADRHNDLINYSLITKVRVMPSSLPGGIDGFR